MLPYINPPELIGPAVKGNPMTSDYVEQINLARSDIAKLQKLLKDIDPASGLSVSLRRGAARDNPDSEDDNEKRPWQTIELCSNMEQIITLCLAARKASLQQWVRAGNDYARQLLNLTIAEGSKP